MIYSDSDLRLQMSPTIEWESVQRRVKAYLRLYMQTRCIFPNRICHRSTPPSKISGTSSKIHTAAPPAVQLRSIYGDSLQQATLDDSIPMAQQLAKINKHAKHYPMRLMGITDNQFSLILLHTLPNSYEVLACDDPR